MSNATSTQLQELYVAYFGRAADPTGLDYWKEKGVTTSAFAANMYAQPEFKSAYGSLSVESQVNQIYKNLFDRSADVTGLTYWTQQIKLGNLQLAEIATHLIWAAQNNSGSSDDKTALTNRTDAAVAYTAKIKESVDSILAFQPLNNGLGTKDFAAGLNITEARSYLSGIDKDTKFTADGIATSVATITTNGIPSPDAKTYTLTSNTDTFTGSTGKDVFQGVFDAVGTGTGTTATSGDSLVGGEGADTFNLSITGASGDSRTIAGINADVEKILISNYDTDGADARDHTFDASLSDGVTTVGLSSSNATGDTIFTNLKAIANAEMTSGSGDLTVTHVDTAVSGTSDSATLTVSGQTDGTFTETASSATAGLGLETLNVVSKGSANKTAITSGNNSVATVNISGDQNLETTITSTALKTVDASSFSGKLDLTYAAAVDLTVKGGSGDDTITFSANNFTSADTIDGGAGTDILEIATAITGATQLKNVSNVETLKPSGGADVTLAADANVMNFDFTETGINVLTLSSGVKAAATVTFGETGADQVDNSGADVALTVKGSAIAIDTSDLITGGSGTDEIQITADTNSDAAIDLNAGNITAVEKITIVDNGDAAITASKGAAGKDINITTAGYSTALTIDASALDAAITDDNSDDKIDDNDESAETLTVDGSSATAVLTITGGGAGDSITGGTKNDVIDGGGGNDTITATAGGNDNLKGGAGDDKFVFGATLTKDDVVDGGAGTDTVSVTTLTAANLAGITNVETLAFTGTATLASDLSFDTIDLTDGNSGDSVTFTTGYTKASTVKLDAGDTVTNSAKLTMAVEVSAADLESADNTVITGSSGATNDSLTITASGEDAANTVATSSRITNVNSILVKDAGDATTGSGLSGSDLTINLASYATALTIDASALDAANKDDSGDGKTDGTDDSDEKLVITGTASKSLTVTGGGGADTIIGSSDTSAGDTLKGGDGDDTFTMAGNLEYSDTIDGGAGTDIITVGAATLTDVAFMKVTNAETLTIDHTTTQIITLGAYFSASGISTVNVDTDAGDKTTVDAAGTTTGVKFVDASTLDAAITGGLGDDTFSYAGTNRLTAGDALDGGAGTDTIEVDNSGGAATIIFGLKDSKNIEKITVKDADGGDTAGAEEADAISITIDGEGGSLESDDGVDGTDYNIEIDATAITDKNDAVTFDASDIEEKDFSFTIKTGPGADDITGSDVVDTITTGGEIDTINGGAGDDVINAGDGADLITGGVGQDTITGGAGNDDFLYALDAATAVSTQAKPDTISDFTTGADEIRISLTAPSAATTYDFTNKGSTPNVSEGIGLLSATGGSPKGQYVFNTTTNSLILDTDGNGLLQSGDLAIKLTGISALADADVAFDITTSGIADVVTTGAGADIVTAAVAGDHVSTGKGDDKLIISVAGAYTSGEFDLGAGTGDVIHSMAAAADISVATVAGVEKITLNTEDGITVSSAQANTFNTTDAFSVTGVNGGNAETFTVKADGGAVSNVDISGIAFTDVSPFMNVDDVKDVLKTGQTDDSFALVFSTAFTANALLNLDAGTGTDVLDINTTSAVAFTAGSLAGFETLDIIDEGDVTLSEAQVAQFTTIKGANGGNTETLTLAANSAGISAVDLSAKTFTDIASVTLTIDNVKDSFIGDASVEHFDIDFGAAFNANAAFNIDGGAGTDVLDINTTNIVDFSAGTIANMEAIELNAGTGATHVKLTASQFKQIEAGVTGDASDKLTVLSGMNGETLASTTSIDTFTFGASDGGATITSPTAIDILDLNRAVTNTGYVEAASNASADFGVNGIHVITSDVLNTGTSMTTTQLLAAVSGGGSTKIGAGESTYAIFKANESNASSTAFLYHLTANTDGNGIAAGVHIASLAAVGDLSTLAVTAMFALTTA